MQSMVVEMNIDMLIATNKPRLVMARQKKEEGLEDLFSFAAEEGEDLMQFKDRMTAEF